MYNCTVCIKGDQEQIKHSKEIDYTAIGFLDEKILNKMVCIICVVHGKGLFLGKDEGTLAIYSIHELLIYDVNSSPMYPLTPLCTTLFNPTGGYT